jgi:branched-chain amino acid aminotransferase
LIVFLNGKFVPEEQAVISVFDRSFLYGDGLFEAILIFNGKPFRWAAHLKRLEAGAQFLKIRLPFALDVLRDHVGQLIAQNNAAHSLLRISLSRGVGLRGYSPKGAEQPSLVMSLHPPQPPAATPPQWRIITSSFRLPANEPLSQFKTCNKLPQIMARAEADSAGANEALLLNTNGHAVEGSSSNLFWIKDKTVFTPPLAAGILPGVTRSTVLEICERLQISSSEADITPERLLSTDGVFFSLTSTGIAETTSLNCHSLRSSALTQKLHTSYWSLVREETQ